MKPNELRIGNLFIEENSNEIIEVIELTKKDITFTGDFKGKWQAKPIEITHEWLLKFGFEILTDAKKGFKSTSYSYRKGISICIGFNYGVVTVDFWQGNEKKYIHELQNFFFAISGTELTYENETK
jgi:hypothetical protein